MNHLNKQSEIVSTLRRALDESVELANTIHLSETELKSLLEERWKVGSHTEDKTPNANNIDERYFNGLAGP